MKLQVTGMTCAACSARVEKVSKAVPGVYKAEVNLLKGTLSLDAEQEAVQQVISNIQQAGYNAFAPQQSKTEADPQASHQRQMQSRILWSAAFLAVLMYFTMGHMVGLPAPVWYMGKENALVAGLLQFLLTLPVVILNRAYYTKGLSALIHRSPNMDSLIAVGSGAALIYGVIALFRMAWAMGNGAWDVVELYRKNLYFESAAMILTLITLGKYLETRAKGKTGDAIRQLMDLSPKTAIVVRNGTESEIPIQEVVTGDIVVVRSGGSIPVDGTVLEGSAAVDQSALTGESVPVDKKPGDTVSAATINTSGYLVIRADKVGEDTNLSQIIRIVEEAGGSKAPIARLADKVSGVFVPVVMGIALISFAAWMLAGEGLEFSLSVGISVLVISCPCTLGLATPVAIMVGTGRGAGLGVLFKNAEVLENLHKVDTVVLDKTGTLTMGKPSVTDILPADGNKNALLSLAKALEAKSEHPFAKAICEYGSVEYAPATEFKTLPGLGVAAAVDGIRCYGGNDRLMQLLGVEVPQYRDLKEAGKTPLYFAADSGRYLGCIAVADVLKPDSAAAVALLKKLGLQVVMLTGDNRNTALAIGRKAGIDQVISDVLPGDKAQAVRKLQEQGKRVLMVGDGINDAPALATADVGMAMGSGTDIAMETADVVLMSGSLGGIANAVELSKATIANIHQNLFWALFYNTLGIPIAAGVLYPAFGILLSPMLGAAAMSCSSVFVVTNALRLRKFKSKFRDSMDISVEQPVTKEEPKMETVIKVEGMMCPHCKARVESVCKAVEGTVDAVVDLQQKQVTVTGSAGIDQLKKAIVDAGYEVIG